MNHAAIALQAGDELNMQQTADKLADIAIGGSEKDREELVSVVCAR